MGCSSSRTASNSGNDRYAATSMTVPPLATVPAVTSAAEVATSAERRAAALDAVGLASSGVITARDGSSFTLAMQTTASHASGLVAGPSTTVRSPTSARDGADSLVHMIRETRRSGVKPMGALPSALNTDGAALPTVSGRQRLSLEPATPLSASNLISPSEASPHSRRASGSSHSSRRPSSGFMPGTDTAALTATAASSPSNTHAGTLVDLSEVDAEPPLPGAIVSPPAPAATSSADHTERRFSLGTPATLPVVHEETVNTTTGIDSRSTPSSTPSSNSDVVVTARTTGRDTATMSGPTSTPSEHDRATRHTTAPLGTTGTVGGTVTTSGSGLPEHTTSGTSAIRTSATQNTASVASPQAEAHTTTTSGMSDDMTIDDHFPPCVYVRHISERYYLHPTPLGKGSFGEVFLGWRKLPPVAGEGATAYEARCRAAPPVAVKCMKPAHPKLSAALAQMAAAGMGVVKVHQKLMASHHTRHSITGGLPDGDGPSHARRPSVPMSDVDGPGHARRPSAPMSGRAASDAGATAAAAAAATASSVHQPRFLAGVGTPAPFTATLLSPTPASSHAAAHAGFSEEQHAHTHGAGATAERRRASLPAEHTPGAVPPTPDVEAPVPAGIGLDASMLIRDRSYALKEADLLKRVRGHDHVVTILDHCDDGINVYIVLEYCSGGDLMKYVLQCKHFSERIAAYLFRQMLVSVQYCHAHGIVHRDIKPDNFLFMSTDGRAHLKITDFGLAASISGPEEVLTDPVGSAYFIAPEVFKRQYTLSCDAWSLGVVLYLLLSGTVPFGAKASCAKDVHRAIRRDPLSFNGRAWSHTSSQARELVSGLLEKTPYKRYTIDQALAHPWITGEGTPDVPIERDVIARMYNFGAHNKLRREALRLVSATLTAGDIRKLRTQFYALDTDADNSISAKELATALQKIGMAATGDAVNALMQALDADGNGLINMEEFLAATTEMQIVYHQNNVWYAFCQLDKDGDGYISKQEAAAIVHGQDGQDAIARYMEEYDLDSDGRINYEEFIRMLLPKEMRFTMVRF